MLINNHGINSNNLGNQPVKNTADDTNKAGKINTDNNVDNVKLSADAHLLASLESAIADASDVDTQQVDTIRQAMDAGQYTIDAEAIAAKLLESDAL